MAGAGAFLFLLRSGSGQEEWKPKLFAKGYEEGLDLAGFSGRPMVLVFGDGRLSGWSEFLLACEADPALTSLLTQKFVGAFVDLAIETEVTSLYGVPPEGAILIKDLRGPLLGILEPEYTCNQLRDSLDQPAKYLVVERSLLYERLLEGPEILAELATEDKRLDAEKAIRCLRRFEPSTQALARAETRAQELGLNP